MRLLLDESLPRPLKDLLVGHDVRTVAEIGWTSLSNGVLLRQAAADFDALLTEMLPIAVVVLIADSNRLESLEPLVPKLLKSLADLQPKSLIRVGV